MSTMFFKVVPQHNSNSDFFLLASFESKMTDKTAERSSTLCAPTREGLATAVARLAKDLRATEVKDSTADAVKKQLEKRFVAQETPRPPLPVLGGMLVLTGHPELV